MQNTKCLKGVNMCVVYHFKILFEIEKNYTIALDQSAREQKQNIARAKLPFHHTFWSLSCWLFVLWLFVFSSFQQGITLIKCLKGLKSHPLCPNSKVAVSQLLIHWAREGVEQSGNLKPVPNSVKKWNNLYSQVFPLWISQFHLNKKESPSRPRV